MSEADIEDGVWIFDDFVEGGQIGSVEIALDERKLALWHGIYSADSESNRVPQGLLTAAMMEAYLKVIPKRPPGNVHAGQKLAFAGRPVAVGATLRFDFSCLAKAIRKERRWVTLGVHASSAGQLVLEGEITTVWAR
jgi:hypothetical protein